MRNQWANVLISDLLDSFVKGAWLRPHFITVHLTSSMNSSGLTASCSSGALAVLLKWYKMITLCMGVPDQAGCLSGCWNLGSHILLCCFSCCACTWQAAATASRGTSPCCSQATQPFGVWQCLELVLDAKIPQDHPMADCFCICTLCLWGQEAPGSLKDYIQQQN